MDLKTKINAEDGKQDMVITREFDLPVELLFKAYADPEIVAQWMGTKVLGLESKKHGGYPGAAAALCARLKLGA